MKCPECGVDLKKNATACGCGWNQSKAKHDRPPLLEDELLKVLGEYMAHKSLPAFMPPAPMDAAKWWIEQQEPAGKEDSPRQTSIVGDDDSRRWICPYHQRLSHALRKFLSLPEKDQRLILAAREDGVFWRGEEMYFFIMVVNETQKMRSMGVNAYREASGKAARECVMKKAS